MATGTDPGALPLEPALGTAIRTGNVTMRYQKYKHQTEGSLGLRLNCSHFHVLSNHNGALEPTTTILTNISAVLLVDHQATGI